MKQWLAAYVRLNHEKKIRDYLTSMGIECFLPVQEEIHQWSDRLKKVKRVVIPMMIFIRVASDERCLPLSLSAVSRYMVLHGESTPAVIPDKQMEMFQFMLQSSSERVEMCSSPFVVGDMVKVVKGPLSGLVGELLMINGKSKVIVRLDKLGCAQVDVPKMYVKAFEKNEKELAVNHR